METSGEVVKGELEIEEEDSEIVESGGIGVETDN